jgi:hypothetical protein
MSEITDWDTQAEKLMNVSDYVSSLQPPTDDSHPETYWQRQYGKGLQHIEDLLFEVENLKEQLAKSEKFGTEKNSELIEYIKQFYEIKRENKELSQKNASLLRDNKELQDKFTCFKADAITSLKAIDLDHTREAAMTAIALEIGLIETVPIDGILPPDIWNKAINVVYENQT